MTMIEIVITVESERPGFVAPEPEVQRYSTYRLAAQGLYNQGLTGRNGDGSWGRTERGHVHRATLTEGDQAEFDEAMRRRGAPVPDEPSLPAEFYSDVD